MKTLAALAIAATLTACAAPKPIIWDKPGGTQQQFDADLARCNYEVAAATQTLNTGVGAALFAQQLDQSLRKIELGRLCMRSKGYTLRQ